MPEVGLDVGLIDDEMDADGSVAFRCGENLLDRIGDIDGFLGGDVHLDELRAGRNQACAAAAGEEPEARAEHQHEVGGGAAACGDGEVDEEPEHTWYQDADGDGLPDADEVPVYTMQLNTVDTRLPLPH